MSKKGWPFGVRDTDQTPPGQQPTAARWPKGLRRQLVMGMTMAPLIALALPDSRRPLVVVAASDLVRVWPSLMRLFEAEHPRQSVRVSFGSSGTFLRQIREGLPFDLFLSADQTYIQDLVSEGRVAPPATPLIQGRLVLSHRVVQPAQTYAQPLYTSAVKAIVQASRTIAIANPAHAPYGRAAQQALVSWGLWAEALPKLVMAESASQAAQFLFQGAAQAAFVPMGLLDGPKPLQANGWHSQAGVLAFDNWVVPRASHQPIMQAMGVARNADPAAHLLAEFLRSQRALKVLQSFGFEHPGAS